VTVKARVSSALPATIKTGSKTSVSNGALEKEVSCNDGCLGAPGLSVGGRERGQRSPPAMAEHPVVVLGLFTKTLPLVVVHSCSCAAMTNGLRESSVLFLPVLAGPFLPRRRFVIVLPAPSCHPARVSPSSCLFFAVLMLPPCPCNMSSSASPLPRSSCRLTTLLPTAHSSPAPTYSRLAFISSSLDFALPFFTSSSYHLPL
jgi:hypothetical protein